MQLYSNSFSVHHVDVEDCARLHVAALFMPKVVNQRIFAAFTPVNSSMLLMMLKDLYPEESFPMENSDTRIMLCNMPNIQAAALLRQMGFPGYTMRQLECLAYCKA